MYSTCFICYSAHVKFMWFFCKVTQKRTHFSRHLTYNILQYFYSNVGGRSTYTYSVCVCVVKWCVLCVGRARGAVMRRLWRSRWGSWERSWGKSESCTKPSRTKHAAMKRRCCSCTIRYRRHTLRVCTSVEHTRSHAECEQEAETFTARLRWSVRQPLLIQHHIQAFLAG